MEIINTISIIAAGLLLGIIFISLVEKDRKAFHFLIMLFVFIFLLRIFIAILLYNHYTITTPEEKGFVSDSLSYSINGYRIAELWERGVRISDFDYVREYMVRNAKTKTGIVANFDFWCAFVYFFIGNSPLALAFLNCIASSFTVIFVYLIAVQLSNKNAAKYAAILAGLWPSLIFWSVQVLKDPITSFLLCGLILFFVSLRKRFRFYYIALILFFSAALYFLRKPFVIVFYCLVIPASLFFYLKIYRIRREILWFSAIIVSSAVVIYFHKEIGSFMRQGLGLVYGARLSKAYGRLAFFQDIDLTNPFALLPYIPGFFIVAILGPFPWQVGSTSQIIAVPEMLLYYLLLPSLIKGIWFVIKKRPDEGGIIIIFVFIMYAVLALSEGNIGTLFRHRSLLLPLLFVLIAIGRKMPKEISQNT